MTKKYYYHRTAPCNHWDQCNFSPLWCSLKYNVFLPNSTRLSDRWNNAHWRWVKKSLGICQRNFLLSPAGSSGRESKRTTSQATGKVFMVLALPRCLKTRSTHPRPWLSSFTTILCQVVSNVKPVRRFTQIVGDKKASITFLTECVHLPHYFRANRRPDYCMGIQGLQFFKLR